ncbi:MAG: DUF3105 domain-containing protein [Sporichthyaceae bacterium]
MANKAKSQDRDRRAKVEALRREQQARERRKSMLFIVIAVVVGLGLISLAAVPSYLKSRNDPAKKTPTSFGVAAAAASCSDVETKPGTNVEALRTHVENGTVEKYATVPPSYGPHWSRPAFPARTFYTKRDRPEMEELVHNLEHGYTVLWYDATITGKQLATLKDVAVSASKTDMAGPGNKFIVSAWDNSYGKFASGKHLGLSHWGAEASHIQLCGKVSGAVVQTFMTQFPSSDAPEANAQ